MASRRTLNADNLAALGAPALAELLLEVSRGSAVIQRRLRLALAAAEGVENAAREVRKRLAAIGRSTTHVDARKRRALLTDLQAQHRAISGPIAASDPGLAFQLLVRLLQLADGVLGRCSDSTGVVLDAFRRAAADLEPLARAAAIAPQALAETLAELLAENDCGHLDGLIAGLAPLLGTEGLDRLESALQECGGLDRHLAGQLAEARGDVEAYLALFDERQLGWPDTAASVALHLLRAGRAEQALAVLERAAGAAARLTAPAWDDALLAVLEALGRSEEAQRHRWQCFCRTLAIPRLRGFLQRLDAFEDVEAEAEALAVAEAHRQPLLALQFLVGWPALPRAARHVLSHRRAWDGEAFEVYGPAAERLSADHPLAATVLLRSMVVFALASGRSQRFRHAAGHLRACELLDARIDDWQGVESHASFVGRLREDFATSRRFWRLLER